MANSNNTYIQFDDQVKIFDAIDAKFKHLQQMIKDNQGQSSEQTLCLPVEAPVDNSIKELVMQIVDDDALLELSELEYNEISQFLSEFDYKENESSSELTIAYGENSKMPISELQKWLVKAEKEAKINILNESNLNGTIVRKLFSFRYRGEVISDSEHKIVYVFSNTSNSDIVLLIETSENSGRISLKDFNY